MLCLFAWIDSGNPGSTKIQLYLFLSKELKEHYILALLLYIFPKLLLLKLICIQSSEMYLAAEGVRRFNSAHLRSDVLPPTNSL